MRITICIFILSFSLYALEDYTYEEGSDYSASSSSTRIAPNSGFFPKTSVQKSVERKAAISKKSFKGSDIAVSTSFKSIDIASSNAEKAKIVDFNIIMNTGLNVALGLYHWRTVSVDGNYFEKDSKNKSHSGNTKLYARFNWLKFGESHDATSVDLLAGYSMGKESSLLATSSDVKMVGIRTFKQFYILALGIGYKMYFHDSTTLKDEVAISDVKNIHGNLTWIISSNLGFSTEVGSYSISGKKSSSDLFAQKLEYSYIQPRLRFKIARRLNIELETIYSNIESFKKNPNFLDARLWNYKGAYGNSISAGLIFTI